MSYDSEDRKKNAEKQIRGPHGTFATMTSETQLGAPDPTLDKPLVSVSINNPFKKLLQWLDQIRRNQNTTFTIKLKLPFIVLLTLFVLAMSLVTSSKLFYDWGRIAGLSAVLAMPEPSPAVIVLPTATPAPIQTTKLGILRGLRATDNSTYASYILEDKNGAVTILMAPTTILLKLYVGRRVLITGMYEELNSTLRIQKASDIEVVP